MTKNIDDMSIEEIKLYLQGREMDAYYEKQDQEPQNEPQNERYQRSHMPPISPTYVGECPKCGSNYGYYVKVVESHRYDFRWDGQGDGEADVLNGRGGTRQFCRECGKDVTDHMTETDYIIKLSTL